MLNSNLNLIIREIVRELMFHGDHFSTCNVIDVVPAYHFFQEEGTEYDMKRLSKIINEIILEIENEFDYTAVDEDRGQSLENNFHWIPYKDRKHIK